MFGWFKKDSPPRVGPDFSPVNSRAKAESAVQRGDLEKLLLLPPEFGGQDVRQNIVYVPVGIGKVKADIDTNIIAPLVAEGSVEVYAATPEYRGRSFVPMAIKIVASDPGNFTTEIAIWGEALERDQTHQTAVNSSGPSPEKTEESPFQILIDQCVEELKLKNHAHESNWDLDEADWNVDQDSGTIVFKSPQKLTTTCSVQMIGTRNDADGSWMWGWDHPSVPERLQNHAKRVRDYGVENNYKWLTTQMLQLPEEKAWELTALACHLNAAQGAFRGKVGPTTIFMTFDNVRITRSK